MLRRAVRVTKRAFGLLPPGRDLTIFPDDTFLVSYPKSGNTWGRFLIANLVWPQKAMDFSNAHRVIPVPEVTPHREMLSLPRPRIIKSHECFDRRFPRTIYIVRDPRDVALSEYHAKRKGRTIEDNYPIELYVRRFLEGNTCAYGSWGDHVASWLSTRYNKPGFLLLRYEDMLLDTARELSRVAAFLGLAPSRELIEQAIQRSSAERMRAMEVSQAQLFNGTKGTRQDILFVRSAKSGNWRSELPENCALQIEKTWGHLIRFLGYEFLSKGNPDVAESFLPLAPVARG